MPRTKTVKTAPAASAITDVRIYSAMSAGERLLWTHLEALCLPMPLPEQRLVPGRLWRTDYCWATFGVALEIEGGAFATVSRHRTGSGYTSDCAKYSEVALQGWLLLRVTTEMVASGEAVALIERAISARQVWAAHTGLSPAIAIPERPAPKRTQRKKAS